MRSVDTDALAEAHYASGDPQFHDDTEEIQRQLDEDRVLKYMSHSLRDLIDGLSEGDLEIAKENADAIGEFLTEYIVTI